MTVTRNGIHVIKNINLDFRGYTCNRQVVMRNFKNWTIGVDAKVIEMKWTESKSK